MSAPLDQCRKCDGKMVRISPEDTSPLIVECENCGYRQYAEVILVAMVLIGPGFSRD